MLAALRLVIGGVLDAFAAVPFCLAHCAGGAVPLVGRFQGYLDRDLLGTAEDPRHGTRLDRPIAEYLRAFYYDTGGFFGDLTAVLATLLLVPPSQILFGTDYPQEIRTGEGKRDFVRALQTMDLPLADREAILSGNAPPAPALTAAGPREKRCGLAAAACRTRWTLMPPQQAPAYLVCGQTDWAGRRLTLATFVIVESEAQGSSAQASIGITG